MGRLNQGGDDDDDDDDGDDKEQLEFFTGGEKRCVGSPGKESEFC